MASSSGCAWECCSRLKDFKRNGKFNLQDEEQDNHLRDERQPEYPGWMSVDGPVVDLRVHDPVEQWHSVVAHRQQSEYCPSLFNWHQLGGDRAKRWCDCRPKSCNCRAEIHHPRRCSEAKEHSAERVSAGANNDDRRVPPLEELVHDRHRDEHDEHEGCRLISLEVAVDLRRPIELELRVQVEIRLLVSLECVERHRHHHDDDVSPEVVVASLAKRLHRLREVLLVEEIGEPFGERKLGERPLLGGGLPLKPDKKVSQVIVDTIGNSPRD